VPETPAPAAFPASPAPPPPQRTSRVGLTIGISLGVLLLGMLSFILYRFSGDGGLAGVTTTSPAPTTTTSALPSAQVGDCVKLAGVSISVEYEKVSCEGNLHNYTVSKVLGSQSERCGEDRDAYTKYRGHSGRKSVNLCLIPVFVEGQCYDFSLSGLSAEIRTVACGSFQAVQAKVLADTVDKGACGPSPALAIAYPEIKTTYCFTHTYK